MPRFTATGDTEPTSGLLAPGKYRFTVLASAQLGEREVYTQDCTSQRTGNPMIQLVLSIDGKKRVLVEYLVFVESCRHRLEQFCLATGIPCIAGEEVEIDAAHCIGRHGWCEIGMEREEYNGRVREKNKVFRYLPRDTESTRKEEKEENEILPDDIPF